MMSAAIERFRERLVTAKVQFGTFIKTPSPHVVELMAAAGLDFVVIDEEHAPFDRSAIDIGLLAAHAVGIPALVRTADSAPSRLLASLDSGAAGVIVPHVRSATGAAAVVAACRYGGARGFSASTRAGGYGARAMWDHVQRADAQVTTIAMIEDSQGVADIRQILDVEGLDGVMVGRADLAVAYRALGRDPQQAEEAARFVIDAAVEAKKPVCLFVSSAEEAFRFRDIGVTTFIVSSDQGLMKQAAAGVVRQLEQLR
jgi:staphyloferrin B biosynthesis citrate synthase